MNPGTKADAWQTFFSLGGIAGVLSLTWQIANAVREFHRKPKLKILELVREKDLFNVKYDPPAKPDERRYVTLQVKNVGKRYARGCVARARATPESGVGEAKEVSLHWADTPIDYRSTGESHVDIAPGRNWRLDIAFSSKSNQGAWLASEPALYGSYLSDATLITDRYLVDIHVTFEDGNEAKSRIRVTSAREWQELDAAAVT